MVIFNGQTFREGADFKRPISDGQLLNYEDTLLYVGGLEGYQGRDAFGWMVVGHDPSFSLSLRRVSISESTATESIFILDGVRKVIDNQPLPSQLSPSLSFFRRTGSKRRGRCGIRGRRLHSSTVFDNLQKKAIPPPFPPPSFQGQLRGRDFGRQHADGVRCPGDALPSLRPPPPPRRPMRNLVNHESVSRTWIGKVDPAPLHPKLFDMVINWEK